MHRGRGARGGVYGTARSFFHSLNQRGENKSAETNDERAEILLWRRGVPGLPLRLSLCFLWKTPPNPACTDVLITRALIHHRQLSKFPPLMSTETGVRWRWWGERSPRPNGNFFTSFFFFFCSLSSMRNMMKYRISHICFCFRPSPPRSALVN